MQQRLPDVGRFTIDQRHLEPTPHIAPRQPGGQFETARPTADDDDMLVQRIALFTLALTE